jgi:ribosomal protein L11
MGPKAKPAQGGAADTEVKTITLKIVGGEAPSNIVLSTRLAPFGCNPKKSGEEIEVAINLEGKVLKKGSALKEKEDDKD